ncbi:hypothetical protein GCM10010911_31310 [Paenibacillus nasutitermitis]|uniref:Extracellular solute-binding protein n=1 Tax=Paenibacillus nasutitermitis TaxID=1652958 RepID=A0A916Z154_9BACL|nr:hypothetical protein GCM10010911_31310 [Paenibacillus nasutitermitis]
MLLLGICTICAALLVPMLGKTGTSKTVSGGLPSEQQPLTIDNGSEDVATIRIAVSMNEEEFDYWQTGNEQFEARFPQIKVAWTNFPEPDAYAKWKDTAHSGEPFDILLLDSNRVREFAVQGYLLPADDIFTGDSLADQLEALTDLLKWNGSMWGVPLDCDPMLVIWQNELLKQAGLSEPPERWTSFVKGFATLQAASPAVGPVNLELSDPRQVVAWLGLFKPNAQTAANLQPLNNEMKDQLLFLDMFSKTLTEEGRVKGDSAAAKFQSGKLLSAVMPWSEYRTMILSGKGDFSVARHSPLSWTGGRSFALSAQSLWPEQARLWMNEMVIKGSNLDRYEKFGMLPVRKSVYGVEFESDNLESKPPYWVLGLFKNKAFMPDPAWSGRWEKWNSLWNAAAQQPAQELDMERIIRDWNGSS